MKTLWLTAVLVAACAIAFAQQGTAGASPQSTGTSSQSVQGCLQHSGGTYTLNASGVQYRVVGGDETQLKGLTGHTVAISGEKSGNAITLQNVQDVSSTCESNSSTTNSNSSPDAKSPPSQDETVPSKENPNRPPMNEQPPIDTPPHAQTPPIGTASSAAADAAHHEAALLRDAAYSDPAPQERTEASHSTDNQTKATMPQGSSELPLVGAVGFGMLAAGMWRRKR